MKTQIPTPLWEWLLRIALALQLMGAGLSMTRQDGSSLAKYVAKRVDMVEAQDSASAAYMNAMLFEDEAAPGGGSAPPVAPVPTEMGYLWQGRIFAGDALLGWLLIASAAWVLLGPNGCLLIGVGIWFAADAWAKTMNAGDTFTSLSLPGQAVRFVAPPVLSTPSNPAVPSAIKPIRKKQFPWRQPKP